MGDSKQQDKAIYFAGPLFTAAEREWNAMLAKALGDLGWKVLLPQVECESLCSSPGNIDWEAIFQKCLSGIKESRALVLILDGADSDSGTCFEGGFAYATGKPIIGVRTDLRPMEAGQANAMLQHSCKSIVHAPQDSIMGIAVKISDKLVKLIASGGGCE